MDNPAVSEPAVPARRPVQQATRDTKTETTEQTPSSISEPTSSGTPTGSKNDEGWRRVVRNFSPSCESPVAEFYVVLRDRLPFVCNCTDGIVQGLQPPGALVSSQSYSPLCPGMLAGYTG
jgi:hypothetical protein